MYPSLDLGKLQAESLHEVPMDLIMKLSIPKLKLQCSLAFPQYHVYQSSLIQNLEVQFPV
jgi:hypothetical protein